MSNDAPLMLPPDQASRDKALDADRSILVQAPAGSGKTDLLTRRFLRLLAEVDEPGQILAITFTNAAAAEMRHRILSELEKAAVRASQETSAELDEFSMSALGAGALARSQAMGWNLIELPAQLRIATIDAFCRELALQQPLLSGLGGGLDNFDDPQELYRRAARRTLEQIDKADPELRSAIETLLLWRDNSWQEMEELLAQMLEQRDKWMHGFVFTPQQDWDALRERLEWPFARAARQQLLHLNALLDLVPQARTEAMELARFACGQLNGAMHRELAELVEFPTAPIETQDDLAAALGACVCLANLLLIKEGAFRKQVDVRFGFPAHAKAEKARHAALIEDLRRVDGLEAALAAVRELPPLRYSEDEWCIVQASFALLRHAAGELRVAFAEAGAVDFTEVAQIAHLALRSVDGIPSETALYAADKIRHLLVDEFQDTSRRQHELLTSLIGAWPEREGRTCFLVGDPMQSIYSFRNADAELFTRVRDGGLEIPHDQALKLDCVGLTSNFRTTAGLVDKLNNTFESVFAVEDGSEVVFTRAEAARRPTAGLHLVRKDDRQPLLHAQFMNEAQRGLGTGAADAKKAAKEEALTAQTAEIVALIRSHLEHIEQARAAGQSYRIAVLGRARKALVPVAQALRVAQIPFRAIELEKLREQPEVLDALALLRALLNPQDRVAWLGVLRAPWCGLSLAELHALTSADNAEWMARPVPDLLAERIALIGQEAGNAVLRVMHAAEFAAARRKAFPAQTLGTWLEQAWLRMGGADCVDAAARANLDLLWKCLDGLPNGERDAMGPALDAALDKLTALPDPAADGECGVQLMTIHKAKGLEFEVVIVPELQAKGARTKSGLLSWLERGLAEPDESGEIAEFLIAPLASKGAGKGAVREWVDGVALAREKQEMRRILYVAATRAREELHLFARIGYKAGADGTLSLTKPNDSLLATAWPALATEVEQQFADWQRSQAPAEEGELYSLAASGEGNRIAMPPAIKPTTLWRLPADYQVTEQGIETESTGTVVSGAGQLYDRHQGGLISRALGTAVHSLLQELARLRQTLEWDAARAELAKAKSRIGSQVRALGIERLQATRIAAQAMEIVLNASRDSVGQWILSPHAEAASETRWTGVVAGGLRTVQVDRVLKAGLQAQSEGADAWWVIDYKTAQADGEAGSLEELRKLFAPQVEAYARVLRNLHGDSLIIRGGLYYPRMIKFDWWEI